MLFSPSSCFVGLFLKFLLLFPFLLLGPLHCVSAVSGFQDDLAAAGSISCLYPIVPARAPTSALALHGQFTCVVSFTFLKPFLGFLFVRVYIPRNKCSAYSLRLSEYMFIDIQFFVPSSPYDLNKIINDLSCLLVTYAIVIGIHFYFVLSSESLTNILHEVKQTTGSYLMMILHLAVII